jgi:hypothetical protein
MNLANDLYSYNPISVGYVYLPETIPRAFNTQENKALWLNKEVRVSVHQVVRTKRPFKRIYSNSSREKRKGTTIGKKAL